MTNMNEEIIINEDFDMVNDGIVADDGNGLGTGVAMLIGAGLAFAVGAAVNLGKKGIAAIKAKKGLKKPDGEVPVEACDAARVNTAE